MKLKQIGYKVRQIPQVGKVVARDEVVDVPKELGEALLKQNTKSLPVWELVKSSKSEAKS